MAMTLGPAEALLRQCQEEGQRTAAIPFTADGEMLSCLCDILIWATRAGKTKEQLRNFAAGNIGGWRGQRAVPAEGGDGKAPELHAGRRGSR